MLRAHRFRALLGVAAVVGVIGFAVHAGAQAPKQGQYISWAAPAVATATPGSGPPLPLASASPVANAGPLGGLTRPLSGLFKQVNVTTAATAKGEFSVLKDLETALAGHIQQFLQWVTGGR